MSITLTVTIRKDVPDQAAAEALYDIVKNKMADKPGIKLSAHTSSHFANDEIEE